MGQKRTYVLSVRPEGNLVLEDVRTRRRALLADFSKIGDQISSWSEQQPDPEPPESPSSPRSPSPRRAPP